eukprot:scaffold3667_cov180-Amphora_coffeaeformis.AAC.12
MSIPKKSHSASLSKAVRSHFTKRQQFLLFIKILIKYIESQHPSLKAEIKKIVRECTHGNRNGVRGYNPLIQVYCASNNVPVPSFCL